MTSCAMLGGMLPLALNLEADNVRAQMALTVVAGLLTSTALSLLFVPVFYVLMARLALRARGLRGDGTRVEAAQSASRV
jgi:hydrophobic/amphiphilic exporter-1 (mainly G- bacteria), HAE1 family